jgi:hypothetical protein
MINKPQKEYLNLFRTNSLLFLASCLSLVFFIVLLRRYYQDDAFITLTYAKNLLEGHGIAWNPGERVEGCSTFLWLTLISLLGRCKVELVFASQLLGLAAAMATLLLFYKAERKKLMLAPLLLSTNSCFAMCSISGLETVLYAFLILACYYLYLYQPGKKTLFLLGVLYALTAMTRLEGIIFLGITFLFCFFHNRRCCAENVRRTLFLAAGFICVFLPYTIWRIGYFGELLSCPVYSKGGTNLIKILFGARYLFDFITVYGFPLAVFAAVSSPLHFLRTKLYIITLLAFYCLYVIIVGGDHMQGFRFFVPILPLFYLLIQDAVLAVRFRNQRVWFSLFVAFLVVLNFSVTYYLVPKGPEANREVLSHSYKYKHCFTIPDPAVYYGKKTAIYMRDNWPENATVALNAAGAQPFYSGKRAIDMLGLNNYTIAKREISYDYGFLVKNLFDIKRLLTTQGRKEIKNKIFARYLPWQLMSGHAKGDGNYVLSLKPDYIIIGGPTGSVEPWFLGDREIMSSPDFRYHYELKEVTIPLKDDLYQNYKATQKGILTFRYYQRIKH